MPPASTSTFQRPWLSPPSESRWWLMEKQPLSETTLESLGNTDPSDAREDTLRSSTPGNIYQNTKEVTNYFIICRQMCIWMIIVKELFFIFLENNTFIDVLQEGGGLLYFSIKSSQKGNFRDAKGAYKSHTQLLSFSYWLFSPLVYFCFEQSTTTLVVACAHPSCGVSAVIFVCLFALLFLKQPSFGLFFWAPHR